MTFDEPVHGFRRGEIVSVTLICCTYCGKSRVVRGQVSIVQTGDAWSFKTVDVTLDHPPCDRNPHMAHKAGLEQVTRVSAIDLLGELV